MENTEFAQNAAPAGFYLPVLAVIMFSLFEVEFGYAMAVWADIQQAAEGPTYRERLEADEEVTLTTEQLDEIFDPWGFLQRKDVLFERLEKLGFED